MIFDENSIKLDLLFFFSRAPKLEDLPFVLVQTQDRSSSRSLSGRIIAPEGNHPRAIAYVDVLIVIIIYKHYLW